MESEQKILDNIQKWLKETSEEFSEWEYDGLYLTIFQNDIEIEKYSKKDLIEIKVI